MHIQSIHTLTPISGASAAQQALSALTPGEVVKAEVIMAEQGRLVLRLPQGEHLEASQRTIDPLLQGDVVLLQLAETQEQGAQRLELLSVNGQPLKAGAPPGDYALLRMQIPPSQANLAIAAALAEMGAPARPETFSRMAELVARFPALDAEAALLFAASSLPIDTDTVEAFSQWMRSPAQATEFAAAAQDLTLQGGQLCAWLESAALAAAAVPREAGRPAAVADQPAATINSQAPAADQQTAATSGQAATPDATTLPPGLSPGLAAKLLGSGVWQELRALLPTLPEKEAQGHILQLLSDLPPETPSVERELIHTALRTMVAHKPGGESPASMVSAHAPEQAQPGSVPGGGQQPSPLGQNPPAPESNGLPGKAGAEQPYFDNALRGLFASLLEVPRGEEGQALREAAIHLADKLSAFTAALHAQSGAQSGRLKSLLEMGQTIITQVQMGGELGSLVYIPLPIILHENRQDASLYVLKRNGGAGGVDESNVTIAICLETQNLGAVDTLLRVERNDITLQFRVDSAEARKFFEDRLPLAQALAFPPPYRFRAASVALRDAPITPLNAGQTLQRAFNLPTPGGLDISI